MTDVFVTDSIIPSDLLYSYADGYGKAMFDRALDKSKAYTRLLCRALLIAVMEKHGIDFISEEKYKNSHGKEYLKSGKIFFNCSHTGHAVAVAVSDSEVGADIERIAESAPANIIKRYFSPSEILLIENSADFNSDFFKLWTKKESYVKYLGTGFSTPLSSFSCTLDDIGEVNGIKQTTYRYKDNFISVTGKDSRLFITENNFVKDGLLK